MSTVTIPTELFARLIQASPETAQMLSDQFLEVSKIQVTKEEDEWGQDQLKVLEEGSELVDSMSGVSGQIPGSAYLDERIESPVKTPEYDFSFFIGKPFFLLEGGLFHPKEKDRKVQYVSLMIPLDQGHVNNYDTPTEVLMNMNLDQEIHAALNAVSKYRMHPKYNLDSKDPADQFRIFKYKLVTFKQEAFDKEPDANKYEQKLTSLFYPEPSDTFTVKRNSEFFKTWDIVRL